MEELRTNDYLKGIVSNLPESPGIYQYLNTEGTIIYVGKAKNLKRRVSSYFNREHEPGKTRVLVSKIADIRYIVVNTEEDALLLENNLIKKYKPRYNVLLKDDKTYPSICVQNEYFPRVFRTRKIIRNGSSYYGPYSHIPSMYALLDLIKHLYPLRTCHLNLSPENIRAGKFNVCLEYHIKNCAGPCIGKQSQEEYLKNIAEIKEILKGNTQEIERMLFQQMQELAAEMKFEEAQKIKKKYLLLENYRAKSEVVSNVLHNIDVFSIEEDSDEKSAFVNYLHITNGAINQAFTFEYKKRLNESKEELLSLGIIEMRERYKSLSREIIVPFELDMELKDVVFTIPQRGDKKKLLELYKKCKAEEKDWIDEIEKRSDAEMRRDKLYLYYTQKGKCMYSGETIELEELWDNQKYDIDHIFPQSKVMDDSLDNRVLVKKKCNQMKEDKYPIDETVRKKMQPFWKSLVDAGLISEEKYKRLIRGNGFEPSELAGFISRQLVETRQSTKAAASILQQVIPDTQIVYVKAPTVSKFRKDFKFLKIREMNDYHHAKDAYLNIVVGNAYFVKFTSNPIHFIKENPGRSYNLKKMFEQEKIERNGEIAWESGNGTIATVRNFMEKNNILVTRRSYEATGALFDQQIVKKGKGQVPIKSSDERLCDIQKYGGYNKEAGAYFVLAESEGKKGKKIRTIEYVPIRLKKEIQKSEENIIRYLEEERQLKNPRVLVPEIKIDTLFCVDGFYMWVSGRSGDQLLMQGANQLVLSQEETEILKKIVQYVERKKQNKELKIYDSDHLEEKKVVMLYETFLNKLTNTVYAKKLGAQAKTLTEKREKFKELCIEEKCIVLYEILHFFQCQSVTADLKLIGGSGRAGILYLNKNITDCSRIEMIHQSPTGIYEQAVDLNAL